MTLDHIPPVRNETSAGDVGPCCFDALYSKCQQDIEVKIASLEVEERRVGRQGVAGATEGWELPSSRLELHFTVRLGEKCSLCFLVFLNLRRERQKICLRRKQECLVTSKDTNNKFSKETLTCG